MAQKRLQLLTEKKNAAEECLRCIEKELGYIINKLSRTQPLSSMSPEDLLEYNKATNCIYYWGSKYEFRFLDLYRFFPL